MRLAFMGSPDFAVPALDALAAAGHEIAAVYCQPPRPAGRGKRERPVPVHARAEALGLEVRTPRSLRDPQVQEAFGALDLDAAAVAAYGLLLPRPVLDVPRLGCLNIHPSLLPRWCGAAPVQRAVMAGDDRTGVCIMRMEEGLDTGAVLMREETEIGATETAGDLQDRLAAMGASLLVATLAALEAGEIEDMPQEAEGVLYARKIDKAEARIDWSRPAAEVAAHVNGLSPFPGAWSMLHGERLKLLRAEALSAAHDAGPGTALDDAGTIACGQGAIRLLAAQRAGKPPLAIAELLRGFQIDRGACFDAPGSHERNA